MRVRPGISVEPVTVRRRCESNRLRIRQFANPAKPDSVSLDHSGYRNDIAEDLDDSIERIGERLIRGRGRLSRRRPGLRLSVRFRRYVVPLRDSSDRCAVPFGYLLKRCLATDAGPLQLGDLSIGSLGETHDATGVRSRGNWRDSRIRATAR